MDIEDDGGKATLEAVEATGAEGLYLHADVSREPDVRRLVSAAVERFGRLDIAVNNAAKELAGPTLEMSAEAFDEVIDTNLRGVFLCMKHEVAEMRKTGGGSIVNQASITSSITGVADNGIYAASKGGVIGLTKSAALQVAADDISVNAIATAGFDIPNDVFMRWIESHGISREDAAAWFPVRRLGRPEEIAAAVLYLASDEARFATGSVLTVDGGFTAQ